MAMETSVYQINKGINKSIEFKGLKAQYIWYLGSGIVALLILFAVMYLIGIPSLICVAVIAVAGTIVVMKTYGMSKKYGEYGMMKMLAGKQVPKVVKISDRGIFLLKNDESDGKQANKRKQGIDR